MPTPVPVQIRWKSLRLFMARKEGQADAMQERALEQLGSHVLMYPDLWPDEDLQVGAPGRKGRRARGGAGAGQQQPGLRP